MCAVCVCLFMYLLFDGSTTFIRFRFHFCVRPFGGSDVTMLATVYSGGGGSGGEHLDNRASALYQVYIPTRYFNAYVYV